MLNSYWGKAKESKNNLKVCDDEDSVKDEFVEKEDNHIYFYSEVITKPVLDLIKGLNDLSKDLRINAIKFGRTDPDPIKLHINSRGGVTSHSFAVLDTILRIRKEVPVHTIVEGTCASAATIIALGGTKRFMGENSHYLIHQLSHIFWGTYTEFQDEQKNLDTLMVKVKEIYTRYTKVPREELEGILKHDLWWDAQKSLEYGVIDNIL